MNFAISQWDRHPQPIEANSLADARRQLRYIARQELRRCRCRFKSGTLHKHSIDSYSITVGKDKRSSLWTSVSLVKE